MEYTEKWATAGSAVLVAALDSDFERKPFRQVTDLVALAEGVTKLTAICNSCKGSAAFTQKIGSRGSAKRLVGSGKLA